MADPPLILQSVRCSRCRRYLCSAIGMVQIKCPACKTTTKIVAGDIGALSAAAGYALSESAREASDTA